MKATELSEGSRAILSAIAEGRSFDQILAGNPSLTYHDIFYAAGEALEIAEQSDGGSTYEQRLAEIRQKHPRAYDKWSEEEDGRLAQLHQQGNSVEQIATSFQRQPTAIRSRLRKLFPGQAEEQESPGHS
jgi:hypothetical protein